MENKEIANIIVQLTDKLGITVSEVTKIFIDAQQKLAIVDIVLMLFVTITTISVLLFTLKYIYKQKKEEKEGSSYKVSITDEDIIMPVIVIVFVTMLICTLISLALVNAWYRLVAPEYMGIKDMISTFIP